MSKKETLSNAFQIGKQAFKNGEHRYALSKYMPAMEFGDKDYKFKIKICQAIIRGWDCANLDA